MGRVSRSNLGNGPALPWVHEDRIAACHALGLITDEEAKQSDILRKVRNEFAHKIDVTFENGAVKDLCNNLSVPEKDKEAKARAKFAKASMLLLIRMLKRPSEVSQMKLKCGDWVNVDAIAPPSG